MALGYSHPDALLAELSSRQIGEWLAYFQLEPFGEERADLRAGIIAAANANLWVKGRKLRPADFMPKIGARKKAQGSKAMRAIFKNFKNAVERKRGE